MFQLFLLPQTLDVLSLNTFRQLGYLAVHGRASIGSQHNKKNCAPGKSERKFTKIFEGMLPAKTSHDAKFHRDRSNQLGDRGGGVNWASDNFFYSVTDGQKHDYLSRDSQRARGANKKWEMAWRCCDSTAP